MDRMSIQLNRIRIRIEASHHALESMIGLARSTTSFLTPLVDIGDNPAVAAHHAVQAWHCALENEVIANRDAFEVCTLAENLQETIPEQLNHRIFNILSPWSAAIEDECHSTGGYGRSAPGLVPLPLCEWCGSFLMPVMTAGWKGLREYCEEVIESFDSILVRTPFPQSMGHALVLARSNLINLTQMLREQESMHHLYNLVEKTIEDIRVETNSPGLGILSLEMIELENRMISLPIVSGEGHRGEEE